MQNYPGDELLLVYDYDFRFGENFYICLTEEAKDWILNVSSINTGMVEGCNNQGIYANTLIPYSFKFSWFKIFVKLLKIT